MNITVKDIGISLWKNVCFLVTAAVLGGILAGGLTCLFVEPACTATAELYVYNEKADDGYISQGDLYVSRSLVETSLIIARSGPVLQETVQKLQPSYPDITVKEIEELLEGSAINATEVFSLSVTDPDGQKAADIVNAVAGFIPGELARITKAATAEIIEPAAVPEEYDWPLARNVVLGAALGFVVSAIYVVIAGEADRTVYGRRELEVHFRIPVIGAVPGKIGRKPVMIDNKTDPGVTDAYRLASAHIVHAENCKKIAVTSAVSGEGKSCCAKNLTKMLTQTGSRVLLIDGASLNGETGLEKTAQAYDYIILDTAALLTAADAAVLSDHIDGYILSAVAGVSNVEKMKEAVRILEQLDANILGMVVHNTDPEIEKYGRYIRWRNKGIRVK